jgi:2-polyprenyl-3-methyl-5-hydroxy-6-metoxy-1,4-benzoquinol methylase
VPTLLERIARKAFRPFYRPYYRLLWRRGFPGAERLERLVRRFEASSRRADVPLDRETWDAQYTAGRWDFLTGDEQLERFRVVAGLVHRHAPGAAVLDVGCGEGLLREHLAGPGGYLGIDLSREAIARAETRARSAPDGPAAEFLVADAETWEPDRRFGAVVLNECLYYFERPLAAARRCLGWLEPGGVMMVSMFRGPRADAIARRLAAELPPAEELELPAPRGRWRIALYRPLPAPVTAPPPARPDTP